MVIILCLYVVALWLVFFEIQTRAMGLVVGDNLPAGRRVHSRNISRAF